MKRAPKPERRCGDGGAPTPRPENSPSPWAEIDAAKAAWDSERRSLEAQLAEAGVKQRMVDGRPVPLVAVNDRGMVEVGIGAGVKIAARDAAALLAAVPGGLRRLKAARLEGKAYREKVLAARAERAEHIERRKAELATRGAR